MRLSLEGSHQTKAGGMKYALRHGDRFARAEFRKPESNASDPVQAGHIDEGRFLEKRADAIHPDPPLRCLALLLFLLLHFTTQLAASVAMHSGFVPIDAVLDIGGSVEVVVRHQDIPVKRLRQQHAQENQYNCFFQQHRYEFGAKIGELRNTVKTPFSAYHLFSILIQHDNPVSMLTKNINDSSGQKSAEETIRFMLKTFAPERYAYLIGTILSFLLLMVCICLLIIGMIKSNTMSKDDWGYIFGMFGSGGIIGLTGSRLLKMWDDCMKKIN